MTAAEITQVVVAGMTLAGVIYNGQKARVTHKAIGTKNGHEDLTEQVATIRRWQHHHDERDAQAFGQLGVEYPDEPTD